MFPSHVENAPLDLKHVMVIGQSNAQGGGSTGAYLTRQRYGNRMFAGGVLGGTLIYPLNYTDILPLVEPVETVATGFSDFIAFKSGGKHSMFITNSADGGAAYAALAKGTAPYTLGLKHVRHVQQKLGTRGRTKAFLSVHGESDDANASYDADMATWQTDLEADANNITDTTGTLPIFHTQSAGPAVCESSVLMVTAHRANPTKNILVGPRYFLTHVDSVHLSQASHRRLGEYYGKAYYKQVVLGQQWEPLMPSSVVRVGAVITITFTGVVGNLALDTVNVVDPGNYGFAYTDSLGFGTINSIVVQGANQVVVTLSSAPTGTNKRIQYGFYISGDGNAGPTNGRRGCLRDTDPEASPNGNSLVNWCVQFDEAAT